MPDQDPATTHILLVEDNPGDADLVHEALSGATERYQVSHETSLSAGLDRFDRQSIDVVLLDLRLPDSSGVHGVSQFNQRAGTIPIVVLTGTDDEALAVSCLEGGAQDYIAKSDLTCVTLRRVIGYALARQRARRELETLTRELKRTNARLEDLASTDPLTEALNRRGIERALRQELDRMSRSGESLVAVLVDCDDFKAINDAFGHAVGDTVLTALTASLRSALRADDHVARIGGDEFLALLPSTTIPEGMVVAEKIRQRIKTTTLPLSTDAVRVAASLAVVSARGETSSLEEVLALAHRALKKSKRSGKDQVSTNAAVINGRDSGECTEAWGAGRTPFLAESIALDVVVQDIRRLRDERVIGYEALTRGPAGVFEMPDDLFGTAFECNVLTMLDLRALRACVHMFRRRAGSGWHHVNLFPSTVLNTPTDALLRVFLEGGAIEDVCIELSEQQFLGDPACLREPIETLKNHGIGVAIDDVGFGRSSLEALIVLQPQIVKVDRRCIGGIAHHAGQRRQLERLTAMLRALGAQIIVEGIESRDDLRILNEIGVPYGQGFLWGKPRRAGQ